MIKKNSKLILGIIIGLIISIGGVYATSTITANQVTIDKTNGKLANITGDKVQDALDYLHTQASKIGSCPEGKVCINSNSFSINPGYLPENDSTTYTQSTFVQNLKVGDLIKMTPIVTSIRLNGNKSGYVTGNGSVGAGYDKIATYLNPSELQYWRVIRKNKNGTVDVVSEYVSSLKVNFYEKSGYQNYIGYLNELASYYENPTYTIGSRYMGYNGQTEILTSTSWCETNKAPCTSSTSSSTTAENEALGAGDMGYQTDYNLVKNAYSGTTTYGNNASGTVMAYQVGTTTETVYYLASRYYNYSSSSSFLFEVRYVTGSGSNSSEYLRGYNQGFVRAGRNHALRPILTLKADVNSISGDGKSEVTAYVLG